MNNKKTANKKKQPEQKNDKEKDTFRIDQFGDFFSNLASNFQRKYKQFDDPEKPTVGRIVKAILGTKEVERTAEIPSDKAERPEKENKTENEQKNNTMETSQQQQQQKPEETPNLYTKEQIDWDTAAQLGLNRSRLEKDGMLDQMLKGYKTDNMYSMTISFGSLVIKLDARLSLRKGPDDRAVINVHGVRDKQTQLNSLFHGYKFTEEDQKNLLKTGHLGQVVPIRNERTNEDVPCLVSLDRKTFEPVASPIRDVKIPDEFNGVKLTEEQKAIFKEGKPCFLEDMVSRTKTDKDGHAVKYNATVQYNAERKYLEVVSFNDLTREPQKLLEKIEPVQSKNSRKQKNEKAVLGEQKQKAGNKVEALNGQPAVGTEQSGKQEQANKPEQINNKPAKGIGM